jgi:dTDP-4-amino-4,6-dideoxygalactose transaminase
MRESLLVPFGDLRLDYTRQKDAINLAITEVLASGWFVLGKQGERFEQAFSSYCDIAHGVGVGSGTEALHLALVACGVQPGDEVITVANTCIPTLSAITLAGAVPVLVDIDSSTYTMDPARIEERITSRTRVILPVHLYGQCADMDPILDIARKYGLKVIEDCAQAHGARYRGRHAGTMGNAGCFSFYPSKNLGAYGDGGMVICGDRVLAESLFMLRNYGQRRRYDHAIKGFNSRLDEMQAAVLLAKLPGLDAANERRRAIASMYTQAFIGLSCIIPPSEAPGRHHVYHLYVVCVPHREAFQKHLWEHSVQTLIHYPLPVHRQESYAECLDQAPWLPVTDSKAPHIVSLPIYPEMTDQQAETVVKAVKSASSCFKK